jgi:hypothetical protein
MLTAFFDPSGRRIRAVRDSSGGFWFDGFTNTLSEAGYAAITARRYLRAAEHFIYCGNRNSRPVQNVDEKFLGQFVHHLDRCRCPHQGHADRASLMQGTRLFLKYMRDRGTATVMRSEISLHRPICAVTELGLRITICSTFDILRAAARKILVSTTVDLRAPSTTPLCLAIATICA